MRNEEFDKETKALLDRRYQLLGKGSPLLVETSCELADAYLHGR